ITRISRIRKHTRALPDPICAGRLSSSRIRDLVARAEILPTLERDRNIPILPDEIVEGTKVEFVALLHPRIGEEFRNLEFADLICEGLAGAGGKGDRFLSRSLCVHRDLLLKILCRFF